MGSSPITSLAWTWTHDLLPRCFSSSHVCFFTSSKTYCHRFIAHQLLLVLDGFPDQVSTPQSVKLPPDRIFHLFCIFDCSSSCEKIKDHFVLVVKTCLKRRSTVRITLKTIWFWKKNKTATDLRYCTSSKSPCSWWPF